MSPFVEPATQLLKIRRPEVYSILPPPEPEDDFGIFSLFMVAEGVADAHRDKNDMVSVVFVMKKEKGKKGGMELGGLRKGMKFEVGDVLIMDSHAIQHATRD